MQSVEMWASVNVPSCLLARENFSEEVVVHEARQEQISILLLSYYIQGCACWQTCDICILCCDEA